jgi:Lrp/AsnC family transcriptional regulator for asnA, asnC and gidA
MRRLEEMGVVKGSKLVIDYQKLGYDLTAFIGIYMEKSALLKNVKTELLQIDEITNIHYTTGVYGLFISLKCKNTAHLREVVQNQIQMIDGIQRTETIISLEESTSKDIKLSY